MMSRGPPHPFMGAVESVVTTSITLPHCPRGRGGEGARTAHHLALLSRSPTAPCTNRPRQCRWVQAQLFVGALSFADRRLRVGQPSVPVHGFLVGLALLSLAATLGSLRTLVSSPCCLLQ